MPISWSEPSSSSSSGPSSAYDSFYGLADSDGDFGVPKKCYCGQNMEVAVSTTEENRGRRYYTCPASEFEAGDHIEKWWDSAIDEELTIIGDRVELNTERLNNIFADPRFEFLRKSVEEMRVEIAELKKVVAEKDGEIGRLKELLKKW